MPYTICQAFSPGGCDAERPSESECLRKKMIGKPYSGKPNVGFDEAEMRGEKLPVVDSLIAVSANDHGLILVTRNVQDIIVHCQIKVFNPWEHQPDQ
jgi:hypothetical protein